MARYRVWRRAMHRYGHFCCFQCLYAEDFVLQPTPLSFLLCLLGRIWARSCSPVAQCKLSEQLQAVTFVKNLVMRVVVATDMHPNLGKATAGSGAGVVVLWNCKAAGIHFINKSFVSFSGHEFTLHNKGKAVKFDKMTVILTGRQAPKQQQ